MPDPSEYDLLGAPYQGATIAVLEYGCKGVTLPKKVIWRRRGFFDSYIADATMSTRFCWNVRDHRAVWEQRAGVLDIRVVMRPYATSAGWRVTEEDPITTTKSNHPAVGLWVRCTWRSACTSGGIWRATN